MSLSHPKNCLLPEPDLLIFITLFAPAIYNPFDNVEVSRITGPQILKVILTLLIISWQGRVDAMQYRKYVLIFIKHKYRFHLF